MNETAGTAGTTERTERPEQPERTERADGTDGMERNGTVGWPRRYELEPQTSFSGSNLLAGSFCRFDVLCEPL